MSIEWRCMHVPASRLCRLVWLDRHDARVMDTSVLTLRWGGKQVVVDRLVASPALAKATPMCKLSHKSESPSRVASRLHAAIAHAPPPQH